MTDLRLVLVRGRRRASGLPAGGFEMTLRRTTRLLSFAGLVAALATTAWLAVRARPALAGATDPALAISFAVARAAGTTTLVEVNGTWEFDNIVQIDFAPRIVVYAGTDYIRIPLGGAPATRGSFGGLSDGLQTSEIGSFDSAGAVEPDAEIVALDAHRLRIALPADFGVQGFSVVAYVVVPGEGAFLSNAVAASAYEVAP